MPVPCPNCQYERQPWDPEPITECPRCGLVYEKYRQESDGGDSRDEGNGDRGARPATGDRPEGKGAPRPTLGTAGIRLPGLGGDEETLRRELEAPPRTSWFWVLVIPVTVAVMAAAVHFQNPSKLLVWLTGSWTEVTRPDGFRVDLPDRLQRVRGTLPVDPGRQAKSVTLYRTGVYGMDIYFAEIETRVPAQGILTWGADVGTQLAAVLLGVDTVETTEAENLFVGPEAVRWEGADLEVDKDPYLVDVIATGRAHTLYVIACAYDDAPHLQEIAERILDSVSFSP